MTKHFCDKCGIQISRENCCVGGHVVNDRLGTEIKFRDKSGIEHTLMVEVLATFDRVLNAGDFCKYCIIDALNRLDDRPRFERKKITTLKKQPHH